MGYYTRYELDFEPESEEVISYLESNRDSHVGSYFYLSWTRNIDDCKWYEHDEDMKSLSRQHPSHLFILSGEGEESGDIWRKYYKNGKVQVCRAKITFDEFDESKLE